jgi:hypothetical protein
MTFVSSLAPSTPKLAARRIFLSFCCMSALAWASVGQAHAGFIGAFQDFSLTNSAFANGYAETFDGGLSLLFTGPNDGSGEYGTTDLTEVVGGSGMFHFSYAYSSQDEAGYDFAGYLQNGSFFGLADTDGQSGTVNLPVLADDIVGFRIVSVDNLGEPGVMSITDFSSPGSTEAPEPGVFSLVLFAIALGVMVGRRWRVVRIGGIRGGTWIAAAAAVGVAFPLSAQAQVEYTGTNVTGSLAFARVVNLAQQAQTAMQSLKLGAISKETRPKMPQKLLRPPVSVAPLLASLGAVPLGAVSMRSLTLTAVSGVLGFNALSHADQRNANHGNQFSIEPPNPSIAASNDYVLEGVNDAVQVYLPSGVSVLPNPVSSNQVYGLAPAINRNTGVNGVYLTDMRVYFDQGMSRWFIVQRSQDNDVAGNTLNMSHLYVAVSKTADPAGDYNIYVMDTTNQQHSGCPCIADYPQLGSDQYGFHIAFNEFNTATLAFVDAGILTLSKAALVNGALAPTAYLFLLPYSTGYEFAIQPAATPPGASNFVANGGLEFFASTLSRFAYNGGVALWAMRNTSSMATASPNPILSQIVIASLAYTFPDVAVQPPGALPYGWSLVPTGQLPFIDGGDCRVQALSYASGRLYLTFPTAITDEAGHYGVGGAYVVLSPTYRNGVLAGSVLNQGYLLLNGNHVLRPAIAVNAQGRGMIAATLVGASRYPSAALIPFDTFSTPAVLEVAGEGALPEDGFSGYPDGGGAGIARWGDYSSAVATSDGAIWMVAEYIGNYPRTEYANWNTYVMRKQP